MSSKEIEVILSRQLADCLSVPVFIVDTHGDLLFYNEPAEELLGLTYDESGAMPASEWSTMFRPEDDKGNAYPVEDLPLIQTLSTQLPSHGEFWINNLRGSVYKISLTSFPIMGRPNRFLGAIAIFWKISEK
jgi:PAS domain-containing protein